MQIPETLIAAIALFACVGCGPPTIDSELARGKRHVEAVKLDQAIQDYTRVLKREDAGPAARAQAMRALAEIHEQLGMREQALANAAELVKTYPGNAEHAAFKQQLEARLAAREVAQAAKHFAAKQYDETVAAAERALALEPKNGPACYWAGKAHFQANRLNAALVALNRAIPLLATAPAGLRADARHVRAYVHYRHTKNWKAAAEDFVQARRLNPNIKPDGSSAVALLYANRYQECLAHARDLPNQAWVVNIRGVALANLGKPAEAIVHYRNAMGLDPHYGYPYANLGSLEQGRGNLVEAVRWFREGLEQSPKHPGIAKLLAAAEKELAARDPKGRAARVKERLADLDHDLILLATRANKNAAAWRKLVDQGNQALRRHSRSARGFFQRASGRQDQGAFAMAIADYSELLKLEPKNKAALNNRAMCYINMKNFRAAIADYTTAIALARTDAKYRGGRARAYRFLGEDWNALADLTWAIELDPQNPWWRIRRGRLFLDRRDQSGYQRAAAECAAALRLAPADASALFLRGRVELSLRQWDAAITTYRLVLKIQPDNGAAYNNIAIAYRVRGRYAEARAALNRALQLDPDHRSARAQLETLDRLRAQREAAVRAAAEKARKAQAELDRARAAKEAAERAAREEAERKKAAGESPPKKAPGKQPNPDVPGGG